VIISARTNLVTDTEEAKDLKRQLSSKTDKDFSWLKSVEGAEAYRRSKINKGVK
jgi:hypothetical protein